MSNDTQITELTVQGMSCGSCVKHVSEALRKLPGVVAVEVELSSGKVRVTHGASGPSVEALKDAIVEEGYTA